MLLIKLSAADLRIISGARSPAEVEGVLSLIRDRVQQAEVLKSFGKEPGPNRMEGKLRWDTAWRICKEVLGDDVYKPPAPEYRWFIRVNSALRAHEMDEQYVKDLAEYVKTHIPGKNAFHFIITCADAILSGQYDRVKKGEDGEVIKPKQALEVLRECQLPEVE